MEVLFAIFLICMGAFLVAATMPISNVSRHQAQNADKAMDVAQKQIEAIRNRGFSAANPTQLASLGLIDSATAIATNTYSFTNSDSANLDNVATVLPGGTGQIQITTLNINTVQMIITVSWNDMGVARSYSVGTVETNL